MKKDINNSISITSEYFRLYRSKLGFTNQADVKNFFGAKDITPIVDINYIKLLNNRLYEIIDRINVVISPDIRVKNIDSFKRKHIDRVFEIMNKSAILPRLNNQRRRPEQVYFSWMQGYILSNYFLKSLSIIFGVDMSEINLIGDDDLRNIKTFKRTAKADIAISLNRKDKIIVEMQCGFTGTNDIKLHKVTEAKKVFENSGFHTLAIHFDLYNGQVAFIKLDEIDDENVNWITRQQMEGQTVFNIDQNYFIWKITDSPIKYKDMIFD